MFILYDKEMNQIEFPEGVTPLDIFISSIGKERVTDRIEGSNETINFGSTYTGRDVELQLMLKAHDTQDYRLLRDGVYAMFDVTDELYVSESYQPGKRYLISVDDIFIPERLNQRVSTATIQCNKVGLPFAESIKTSMDIHTNGLRYGDGWSYGMGLLYDEDSHKYSHDVKVGQTVKIYNPSNIDLHPFEHDMYIKIENVKSDKFMLRNRTTDEAMRFTKKINKGDVIEIKGAEVLINDAQALRYANKNFITLAKGWNEFTVYDVDTEVKLTVDFRFYYN